MNPIDAPRKAPSTSKYVLTIISNADFEKTFSDPLIAPLYGPVALNITLTYGRLEINSKLIGQLKTGTNQVSISVEQVKNFSDQRITGAVCSACPGLFEKIRESGLPGLTLPFTEQAKESVMVPLTREVAANIILAFFNATMDPMDRINQVVTQSKPGTRSTSGRLLTTYYLCCIKYLTDLDMTSILLADSKCEAIVDDLQIVTVKNRHTYLGLKEQQREISKELVAFHAVYGSYVMCRPVATKRSFREWITKRYSSFLSSIQYSAESNVSLPLQAGGTQVNEIVVERAILRRLVYQLTKIHSDDIIVAAIKNHVSFLTSLSEMTTYALINQVISKGGAVICITPLSQQVAKYAKERMDISELMITEGIPEQDIVYLHLIKPNIQCFRSSEYPDLVKTAQILDKIENPSDQTLENYRAKIQGATCDEVKIKQFLRVC